MAVTTDRLPNWFQRAENAFIAALVVVAFVDLDFAWWWLFALFLLFDASMVGYALNARLGAWTYNAVHSYIGPAVIAAIGFVAGTRWAAFVASVWGFHIAADRLLGYGLKYRDRFTHTHLGEIGRDRDQRGEENSGISRETRFLSAPQACILLEEVGPRPGQPLPDPQSTGTT